MFLNVFFFQGLVPVPAPAAGQEISMSTCSAEEESDKAIKKGDKQPWHYHLGEGTH